MVPFLVVAGLLMLGVAIVAWATRPTASYPVVQQRLDRQRQRRVLRRGEPAPAPLRTIRGQRPTKPALSVQPEAFSKAPASSPPTIGSGLAARASGSIVQSPVRPGAGGATSETLP